MANDASGRRLREWLAEGDLRSDGLAPEVARLVSRNRAMLEDLLDALAHGEDVVRGHAADALERVSREQPEGIGSRLNSIVAQARSDPVPMVRWHLAMILGNLAYERAHQATCLRGLLPLLRDISPFVKSWAISGLCQIGRRSPARAEGILGAVSPLTRDSSIAVRHRATKAITLLTDPHSKMPGSWTKRKV
jgi:HEAT repeat protein